MIPAFDSIRWHRNNFHNHLWFFLSHQVATVSTEASHFLLFLIFSVSLLSNARHNVLGSPGSSVRDWDLWQWPRNCRHRSIPHAALHCSCLTHNELSSWVHRTHITTWMEVVFYLFFFDLTLCSFVCGLQRVGASGSNKLLLDHNFGRNKHNSLVLTSFQWKKSFNRSWALITLISPACEKNGKKYLSHSCFGPKNTLDVLFVIVHPTDWKSLLYR